jgi:cobalt-zinc-cadmium efflux system protein
MSTAPHACASGSHPHGPHAHGDLRRASGRALRLALAVLATFFAVELVGGLLTNSLALLSDAAHLLSDVAAVGLALFAQWFARRPASAARSFGYRRVEILAAQLNGFTLLLVAVFIGVEAYRRMQAPPAVLGLPMILVATAGLVAQVITTLVLARAQRESLNVRGAYLHAMTDAVQSVGVVVAGAVMLATGWYIVDPIVSVLIGLLVAGSGVKILFEATHVLIEGTPRGMDLDEVARMMHETRGVRRVTDLHAWSLTTGYNALSAHVVADPADDGHDELRRRLIEQLQASFPLQHITLQIERECECPVSDCCGWLQPPPPADKQEDS